MKLIVGLGNPGKKYEKTRHNAGFMALDFLAKKIGAEFKFEKRFNAEITTAKINNQKIILAKPQTFINLSGLAVARIKEYYKIDTKDLIFVFDDIDLLLGKIRVKKSGSSGGHNGVESIIRELGTKEFLRIKIGISNENRTTKQSKPKIDAKDYVLGKFTKTEEKTLKKILEIATEEIVSIIEKGAEEKTINVVAEIDQRRGS